jgi:hypothetical protein
MVDLAYKEARESYGRHDAFLLGVAI